MSSIPHFRKVQHLPLEEQFMWQDRNRLALYAAMEASMRPVSVLDRLDVYSSPHTALRELFFVQNESGPDSILCQRLPDGRVLEASLLVSGVVAAVNMMPFTRSEQIELGTSWSTPGNQSIAIVGFDHSSFILATEAIANIRAMAQTHCPIGFKAEPCEITLHDQTAIIAQTPLGTARHKVAPGKEQLPHSPFADPCGVMARWCTREDLVPLESNHVDTYRATPTNSGKYDYFRMTGEKVRYGEVVQLELGFQIIPQNGWLTMNIDLRSVSVVDSTCVSRLRNRIHAHTPTTTPPSELGIQPTIIRKPRNAYIIASVERAKRAQEGRHHHDKAARVETSKARTLRDALIFGRSPDEAAS
ncbi:unnamed protein product [Peniophora sp. CBMAI 1063]|nr:unnamed protein product [Peniophora sp. CBMAI 1063]